VTRASVSLSGPVTDGLVPGRNEAKRQSGRLALAGVVDYVHGDACSVKMAGGCKTCHLSPTRDEQKP
jgi:hypothetical protein